MSAVTQKLHLDTDGFVIVERVLGRAMRERLSDGACRMAPWTPARPSRDRAPETVE